MALKLIPLVAGLLLGQVSAVAPLQSSSAAASSSPVQARTQASVYCHTKLGTSSISGVLPTSTITRTRHDPTPVIITSTTQATVTETPAVVTVTETDYVTTIITTTAATVTDTFSTTSTDFATSTVVVTPQTVTSTVAVTVSTTTTVTSTIAPYAGFTPLADTLPTVQPAKRSLLESEEEEGDCAAWLDDYQYPQAVECHEKIVVKSTSVATVTAVPITTTLAGSTTTATVTSTIFSSSVVVPSDVSTTLSFSTTSTITETATAPAVTATTTTTNTVSVTTSTTFQGACATNNVASLPLSSDYGNFVGQYIYLISFTNVPGESISVGNTASAYDCCVSCQESSTCAMSYFNQLSSSLAYCYLIHTTTCSSATTYATARIHGSAATIQMSNGPCGRVVGLQD
ncbi:uncharacterized protein BP01DRAFT_417933 [Aspergillus saccharolyticus JOP 1030-1]|uniref:Apple domain-containing protein n=1 Tax=Aspergillus saccharolyticus JOP 1030-1 TaxID=1450539 RepID=A0A318Z7V7_9EURO|nr:hypothetical protein BP01DRAFT_417933 [Aspergillus saccharolyticus JOP 1030-1]PYH42497.1 hypothetical protein BP01DRAFT_417933 [Aspergillus saccharolyticus JOP 1030-1]